MDQTVNRSLFAEFDRAAEMDRRKAELNALMTQASPSYTRAANLLIKEMLFALEIDEQEEHYLERANLVDFLINQEELPEEYAHQLLRLKLAYHLHKKNYDYILHSLSRLEDPEDRLACSTYEYYNLLFMKFQVLLAQHKYQQAYNYIQHVCDTHFDKEYFLFLPLHERDNIINAYLLNKAIAAHFCVLPESYDLFQQVLQRPNSGFQLKPSNVNTFILFGNECLERNNLDEAAMIFSDLFTLLSQKENKTEGDLNAYSRVKAMMDLTMLAVSKQTWIKKSDEKNKEIIELISKRMNKKGNTFSPLFNTNSTPQIEESNEKTVEASPLVGKITPTI